MINQYQDWQNIKLSKVIDCLETGKRPKGGVSKYKSGIPSLGGEHLNNDGGFNFDKIKFVPSEFAEKMTKGRIYKNDILIVKDGATTGKTSLVKEDFPYKKAVINEHLFSVRLPENVNKKWIFYQLYSHKGKLQILEDFRGAPGGITLGFPDFVDISLPNLEIQNVLVNFLDEQISKLEQSKKYLLKSKKLINFFKQSFLKDAFSGKLTKEWRDNKNFLSQKDLLDLLEHNRGEKFKEIISHNRKKKLKKIQALNPEKMDYLSDLPKNWIWEKLGLMTCGVEYGTSEKSTNKGKCPVIRMGNIQNSKLDLKDLVFTNNDDDIMKYELSKGDVLFNRTNSPEFVVKSAIFEEYKTTIFAGYLIRINHIDQSVDSKYLNYFLNSPFAKIHGNKVKTDGVNQSNINGDKLINYPFPYCSLAEQKEIVNIIENKFNYLDNIMVSIDKSLDQITILKESIFQNVFAGNLKL